VSKMTKTRASIFIILDLKQLGLCQKWPRQELVFS
jgi:hypothetical protein